MIDADRWRFLEPLLDRALELSAGERPAWLAELRQHSPDVADELAHGRVVVRECRDAVEGGRAARRTQGPEPVRELLG